MLVEEQNKGKLFLITKVRKNGSMLIKTKIMTFILYPGQELLRINLFQIP